MRGIDAVVIAALVLAALWILTHAVPGVSSVAEELHPSTCPSGTFMAADGFCTHVYRASPTPHR